LSGIKGGTILTLIEIAHQYPNDINPTKLSELLKIPPATFSEELKRLTKFQFISPIRSVGILGDARYKYYTITPKGTSFLDILKKVLRGATNRLETIRQEGETNYYR
jgi:DNA-binding MarR family transcriptional regulator